MKLVKISAVFIIWFMSIFLVINTNNQTGMFCFIFKTTLGVCVANYSFSVKLITLLSFTKDLIKKKVKPYLYHNLI